MQEPWLQQATYDTRDLEIFEKSKNMMGARKRIEAFMKDVWKEKCNGGRSKIKDAK